MNSPLESLQEPEEEVEPLPESSQPEKEKPAEAKPALVINVQSWATPIVGLVMLAVGLLIGYAGRPLVSSAESARVNSSRAAQANTPAPAANQGGASTPTLMEYLISQTRHFKGDPNAPVTIIEFSDYQWPYCGRFATGAGRQIDQTYVDSGKVRFGYWHFAFLGTESQWAAEASECAADQNAFWPYHDLLFDSQSGENQGAFSKDNLKKFAAQLKLDTQAFNECLDGGKYTNEVKSETSLAQSFGVSSTPAFVINGQPMIGAQPFEAFQQAIDQYLGNK